MAWKREYIHRLILVCENDETGPSDLMIYIFGQLTFFLILVLEYGPYLRTKHMILNQTLLKLVIYNNFIHH